jgi:alkanesulfonate monooxygenase SsuD/methylene tetrahydromethanopterin reductase-like flavin-dependent oxidoreductase (luciferase family)
MAAGKPMPDVAFGIWDHIEDRGEPLADLYEGRLRLLEAADAGPFRGYHLAEHHFTPLGMAPSPAVFLAAAAQRTRRLRLGSMVHLLPLYHPLRLHEELCMLDQLAGGRLDVGVGRGVSPFELGLYGVPFPESRPRMEETLAVLRAAFALPRGERLTHLGEFWRIRDVPLRLAPAQRPHPPLWYGAANESGVRYAAREGMHLITAGPNAALAGAAALYRAARSEAGVREPAEPVIGAFRLAFLDEDGARAERRARAAYAHYYASLQRLFVEHGTVSLQFPPEYDALAPSGTFLVGSPATVREQVEAFFAESGCNYLLAEVVWGDLAQEESLASLSLLAEVAEGILGRR